MRDNKGITLTTLIITIIVLLILTTLTINVGTNQFENMKLKGFYTKLEIAQERSRKNSKY